MALMEKVYEEIIQFVVSSGKRIAKIAGKIKDIGIKKQYLTEEDLAIERGMRAIILKHKPKHGFFAEEEHDSFPKDEDVWIVDPISGTKTFIQGLPHYGIAIAHTKSGITQFGAVYDPSANELFTAYRGKGAFLNGKKISISKPNKKLKVVLNLSLQWKDEKSAQKIKQQLSLFDVETNQNSFGVNLCHLACGRFDGTITFCKDTFPIFAGALIIQEAGGTFTNDLGNSNISQKDRIFVGGNKEAYKQLWEVLRKMKLPKSLS